MVERVEEVKKRLEKTRIILLATLIASLAVVGIGAVAYAQTSTRSSGTGQCGSMMNGMGGTGMMGQSGSMQSQCQGMMDEDMGQCQAMMNSQNMDQCQSMMRQQNMTQACH